MPSPARDGSIGRNPADPGGGIVVLGDAVPMPVARKEAVLCQFFGEIAATGEGEREANDPRVLAAVERLEGAHVRFGTSIYRVGHRDHTHSHAQPTRNWYRSDPDPCPPHPVRKSDGRTQWGRVRPAPRVEPEAAQSQRLTNQGGS